MCGHTRTKLRRLTSEVQRLEARMVAVGLVGAGGGPIERPPPREFAPVRPYWSHNDKLADLTNEMNEVNRLLEEGRRSRGRGAVFSDVEERALVDRLKVLKAEVAEARKGTEWGENASGDYAPVRPYWLTR